MNIHIIGGGSLGLLYAGKLADSGCRVTLWCRSEEQADKLRASGITIEETDRHQVIDAHAFSVSSWSSFAESGGGADADYLFLMLKQQGIEEIAAEMLALFGEDHRRLLCFQNGTGHLERLQDLLPMWTIYAAITTEGAKRTSSVSVLHAGRGTTTIGKMMPDGSSLDALSQETHEIKLVKQLNRAGFEAFLSNEMDEMIYRKLLINAVINPLTALWRIPNGELLTSPERVSLMKQLYNEGIAVYEAAGIPYGSGLWEWILSVCQSTSSNTSSMLKDVMEGRTTEVAWINGSIVRLGQKYGISVPIHELITQLIEGMNT
ncbi:ketopantoate reductase family protein [Paenibacillus sp. MDMC362]|uniref:ketopantoate reductase family protein n=1 Tax=Paenibacillus sp. MDMC362 TaxID=2977365 RepID=UPI000DC5EFAB|nr:2-dehydropantoate 2-reductase [Paenibacillus sp. MDMC362]RAR45557.1 2-dehydropantoate 2-reductase [Paenibacillus sp. MDMC362]